MAGLDDLLFGQRGADAPDVVEESTVPARVEAVYDEEGCNQWGVKYHNRCPTCQGDYPTNMVGMGTCRACKVRYNAMSGTAEPIA